LTPEYGVNQASKKKQLLIATVDGSEIPFPTNHLLDVTETRRKSCDEPNNLNW